MKIQHETKLFIGILIISLVTTVIATAQANDYYALTGGINNLQTTGVDTMDITYPVYYIPVTSGGTYTFSLVQTTTEINLSQPAQINTNIKNSIKNYASSQGYNLKKIIMQSYNVINP